MDSGYKFITGLAGACGERPERTTWAASNSATWPGAQLRYFAAKRGLRDVTMRSRRAACDIQRPINRLDATVRSCRPRRVPARAGFSAPGHLRRPPDPIVHGFAQIGPAQNPSAYAAFADEIDFRRSRREQSGTTREKFGWRRNAIRPPASGAGDLHAGFGQHGIRKAGKANEFEYEVAGR
jgi:hypothetical protein